MAPVRDAVMAATTGPSKVTTATGRATAVGLSEGVLGSALPFLGGTIVA